MTSPGTMTLAELQKLVAESKGEWEHLEFKKTTGELHGGMESLCAFLNGVGGKVLFGVTNAGKIQGQDMADATYQEVANAIRKLEPPAWIEQIRVPVAGTKEVLILETTQQTDGPYTFDGRPYQRIGNTTSRMPQAEYQRRLLARAQRPAPVGKPGRRRVLREVIWTSRRSIGPCGPRFSAGGSKARRPTRSMRSIGSNCGSMGSCSTRPWSSSVASSCPYYPQCTVRLARFKGTDKSEFLDQRQLHGHAFQILDESMHFILRNHLRSPAVSSRASWNGRMCRCTRRWPCGKPWSMRSAIGTTRSPGGAIFVAIYDDRLEVTSLGSCRRASRWPTSSGTTPPASATR